MAASNVQIKYFLLSVDVKQVFNKLLQLYNIFGKLTSSTEQRNNFFSNFLKTAIRYFTCGGFKCFRLQFDPQHEFVIMFFCTWTLSLCGIVLSWWCFVVFNYTCIMLVCTLLVQNVSLFPILIWQKWTKCWTKVVIHGNLVPTKATPKGITNLSTLRYMTARLNISLSLSN